MVTRRRIVVVGGAIGASACATPTQPKTSNNPYEISFTAEISGTVAQALQSNGYELSVDTATWAQVGQLVVAINGAMGNWRVDVNGEWFGPDVARKQIVPGDQIGCWRQSSFASAFDRWLHRRTQALRRTSNFA